jgi:hypothetical protein
MIDRSRLTRSNLNTCTAIRCDAVRPLRETHPRRTPDAWDQRHKAPQKRPQFRPVDPEFNRRVGTRAAIPNRLHAGLD